MKDTLSPELAPSRAELADFVSAKYGPAEEGSAVRRMRARFAYHSPDDYYEAVTEKLVTDQTAWIDIGCGRSIFPSNRPLAEKLAARCRLLVGVDPDETLEENELVHQKVRSSIEQFESTSTFDLITMRMVAEHVTDPESVVRTLSRLTSPHGRVVIYTVNKWSPASMIAKATPMRFHHFVKRLLWGTEEKDTFPVAYRMNTRAELRSLFEAHGFSEDYFAYLDDCRSSSRFPRLHFLELSVRAACRYLGFRYFENCLLAVYRKS